MAIYHGEYLLCILCSYPVFMFDYIDILETKMYSTIVELYNTYGDHVRCADKGAWEGVYSGHDVRENEKYVYQALHLL